MAVLRVTIYEKHGFAFINVVIVVDRVPSISVFAGMIFLWEVGCGIVCTALGLWVEILVGVFPLRKLH